MRIKNITNSLISIALCNLIKKKSPLSVQYAITKKCNLACNYCYVDTKTSSELNTKQIFSFIDELNSSGCQRLNFTGGEPLLRNDLKEIIDYANNKKIITSISSNGYLFERIKEIKPDLYHFSLDGNHKIHDFLRGVESFDRLIKSIKIARKNNIKVWTTTVLNKYNLNDIDFILNLAEELDFYCHFTPIQNLHEHNKGYTPNQKLYFKAINHLIKLKNKRMANSKGALNYLLHWPSFKGNYKCYAGKLHLYIDSNGDLYPCISQNYKTNIKNGFKKAFNQLQVLHDKCNYCICQGLIEQNNLFSLNIDSIYHALNYY